MEDIYCFGGNPLDRVSERREDDEWIAKLLGDPDTRILPLRGLKPFTRGTAVPAKYTFAPRGTPAGQPYNVAQAYARAADALRGGGSFDVDFNLAVQRHRLIDAIERSSASGRSVRVDRT